MSRLDDAPVVDVPAALRRASTFVAASVREGDLPRALDALGAADAARLRGTPHLGLYAELVRASVTGAVATQIPRAAAALTALDAARLAGDVAAFLAAGAFPSTHYLRDLPPAFLRFAIPRWEAAGVPAWIAELAHHELLGFLVAAEDAAAPPHVEELALDLPVVLAPWAKLARYAYAVHEIEIGTAACAPSPRATALVVYRDATFDIRHLELTPLAALIFERLQDGAPLETAIRSACADASAGFGDDELTRFLADLSARGILLGRVERAPGSQSR